MLWRRENSLPISEIETCFLGGQDVYTHYADNYFCFIFVPFSFVTELQAV